MLVVYNMCKVLMLIAMAVMDNDDLVKILSV
jgi:hypothetical protein